MVQSSKTIICKSRAYQTSVLMNPFLVAMKCLVVTNFADHVLKGKSLCEGFLNVCTVGFTKSIIPFNK